MTLQEVYEKYKHLDTLILDNTQRDFIKSILCDLWLAIKQEIQKSTKT